MEEVQVYFKELYGESPNGSENQGCMINEFHTERVENLIKTAGGTLVCGGKVNKEKKFIEPTVILQPSLESGIMKEEIFGPVMPVFPFKDIREVIKYINKGEKPLAVYYFGEPTGANSVLLSSQTSSGSYVTNECIVQILNHHTGFGGVGMSGQGRHGGFEGWKQFCNKKAIFLKNASPMFLAKMAAPPYTAKTEKTLRKWIITLSTTNVSWVMWYVKLILFIIVAFILEKVYRAYYMP